jgi:hypothetical protein
VSTLLTMLFPNSDFVGVAELQRGWLHVLTRHEVGSRNIMNARAVAANVMEKSTDRRGSVPEGLYES